MSLQNQIFNLLKVKPAVCVRARRTFFKRKKQFRELCPNDSCKPKKPHSFWDIINRKKAKVPACEACRIEQSKCVPDPDLSQFQGTAYKTCGSAYAIEMENLPTKTRVISNEDKIIMGIEANLDRKHDVIDTIPDFINVEQRMMDLNERRLHPFYRMYQYVSSKRLLGLPNKWTDRFQNSPQDVDVLPKLFRYDANVLDLKNIHFQYKRIEPPDQITKRMLELRQRQRPEPKAVREEEINAPLVGRPTRTFDSLYQHNFEF